MLLQKLSARERAVHLLNRAGFGPRPGDVERVLKTGTDPHLNAQLHPERLSDHELDRWESEFPLLTSSAREARDLLGEMPQPLLNHLLAYKVMRAIHSNRQLQEVLTDFWFNHFNVEWGKGEARYLTHRFERDVIRPKTLGKFADMLLATAEHPAMLVYLDNALSSSPKARPVIPGAQPGINENYARELLELHTMGVDGGYSQRDVEEVARCFTGWTIDRETLVYRFDVTLHDPGAKTVLGTTIPDGGIEEGIRVVQLLASHPSTAKFIAGKLARRFVADQPPASLVEHAAGVFSRTSGDIREVCRTILSSEEFFAPGVFRRKVKSPFELVVSSVRAIDATVLVPRRTGISELVRVMNAATPAAMEAAARERAIALEADRRRARYATGLSASIQAYTHVIEPMHTMGQMPYQVSSPKGYPETGEDWLNALTSLNRMTFGISLAENRLAGMEFGNAEMKKLAGSRPPTSWEGALGILTGLPGTQPLHSNPAKVPASAVNPSTSRMFALALGSPDFQYK